MELAHSYFPRADREYKGPDSGMESGLLNRGGRRR